MVDVPLVGRPKQTRKTNAGGGRVVSMHDDDAVIVCYAARDLHSPKHRTIIIEKYTPHMNVAALVCGGAATAVGTAVLYATHTNKLSYVALSLCLLHLMVWEGACEIFDRRFAQYWVVVCLPFTPASTAVFVIFFCKSCPRLLGARMACNVGASTTSVQHIQHVVTLASDDVVEFCRHDYYGCRLPDNDANGLSSAEACSGKSGSSLMLLVSPAIGRVADDDKLGLEAGVPLGKLSAWR